MGKQKVGSTESRWFGNQLATYIHLLFFVLVHGSWFLVLGVLVSPPFWYVTWDEDLSGGTKKTIVNHWLLFLGTLPDLYALHYCIVCYNLFFAYITRMTRIGVLPCHTPVLQSLPQRLAKSLSYNHTNNHVEQVWRVCPPLGFPLSML